MSDEVEADENEIEVPRALRRVYEEVTTYDDELSADHVVEIEQLEELLTENPGNLDVMEWLAFKLYSVGQYARAERTYRDLIRKDHRTGVQHFYLGNTLYKMQRVEAAVEAWQETVRRIPTDPKAQKAKARIEKVRNNESAL